MILQSLCRYYERLLTRSNTGIAPFGYSPEKISFEIVLTAEGKVVAVNDIRDTSGKRPFPRIAIVPQPPKRTVDIAPNFLWDKTSYVLGVSETSKRSRKEHAEFRALHEAQLEGYQDPGLRALVAFLRRWSPDQFAAPLFPPDVKDTNVVFRLDGTQSYVHESPDAQSAWTRLLAQQADSAAPLARCLVTGELQPIQPVHPAIKGVFGAQSSGASIVSFNMESFCSYGKEQGANAPMGALAVFAYTTVLNYLLQSGAHHRQRLAIGDTTVVFWAETADTSAAQAAELLFSDLLNPPVTDTQEAAKVLRVLEQVRRGAPLAEIDPNLHESTRLFVLGLAANASRLSVRYWETGTLGSFGQRLADHERDLRLYPSPWAVAPNVRRLAIAAAPVRKGRSEEKDIPPQLAGELMRAVLSGRRYPRSFMANVLMRIRSDGDVSAMRVAVCKATLARDQRLGLTYSNEEIPVALDKQIRHPAYRVGRLFAVLEQIQGAALGKDLNASIRDRYFGAASATPASVFPMLLRNAQNHLGKLRRSKPGFAVNLEKDIREIIDGLGESFPRSLRLEDQGRFAIGYYHQSEARYARPEAPGVGAADSDQESEPSGVAA